MNVKRAVTLVQVLTGMLPAESWAPSTAALAPRLPSKGLLGHCASSLAYHSAAHAPAALSPPSWDREDPDLAADWVDIRYSASDWFHNVVTLPNSTTLREIRGPVGCIAGWSTLVSLVYRVAGPRVAKTMCLGTAPHSLIASSIGLLLVFRTNSAYQRFTVGLPAICAEAGAPLSHLACRACSLLLQEGRKVWEQLLNTCRDVTRMTSIYENEVGSRRKQRIQRLLAAFPYLLHHHIQPKCLDHSQCEKLQGTSHPLLLEGGCWVDRRGLPWRLLPAPVLAKMARSHNRPLWVADRLAFEIADIPYCDNWTSRERLELLKCANKLSECVGNCERRESMTLFFF